MKVNLNSILIVFFLVNLCFASDVRDKVFEAQIKTKSGGISKTEILSVFWMNSLASFRSMLHEEKASSMARRRNMVANLNFNVDECFPKD